MNKFIALLALVSGLLNSKPAIATTADPNASGTQSNACGQNTRPAPTAPTPTAPATTAPATAR